MLARRTTSCILALALLPACVLSACVREAPSAAPRAAEAGRPRLVVVLVIDQMRADYLTRYGDLYRGGLARLRSDSALFTEAHIQHALTYTAPGHASVSTATHPNHHGIVENEWYDREARRTAYAADDERSPLVATGDRPPSKDGRSPAQLLRPGLGDWLKRQVPQAKVYSVALKDRASVMLGGQRPDRAFWFDAAAAGYVSSRWYGGALPEWVARFNASGAVFQRFESGWTRVADASVYARSGADRVASEYDGARSEFPHVFDDGTPQARETFLRELSWTPFGDELTLAFAEELLRAEQLGEDEHPDLLLVSCSSADYVGHRYGPFSHEAQDYYLRLDAWLGRFLAALDAEVGRDNYVLALTSDHGALPLPEELEREGEHPGRRVQLPDYEAQIRARTTAATAKLGLPASALMHVGEDGVWLDVAAAQAQGVKPEALRAAVAAELKSLDFVAETFTADQLGAQGGGSPYLERYRRSFHPARSPDVTLRFQEWTLAAAAGPGGTSHGSPYRYDTHVPLLFLGPGVRKGQLERPVGTVDVAPTLAELLQISPPADIDGSSLAPLIAGP